MVVYPLSPLITLVVDDQLVDRHATNRAIILYALMIPTRERASALNVALRRGITHVDSVVH
jgi:hypothetical protein